MGGDITTDFGYCNKERGSVMWINSDTYTQYVLNHFMFLSAYGMQVVDSSMVECVRFESHSTWLEVWFDKYSLFVTMGLTKYNYELSLWDIMEYTMGKGSETNYMASDEEKLGKGIKKLSDYVKQYCEDALLGDIGFYSEILKKKELQIQENIINSRNRYVEECAKNAWDNANFNDVIALYQSINEDLTPIQKKRLSLSLKRVGEAGGTEESQRDASDVPHEARGTV
jgi:hypothetical protein